MVHGASPSIYPSYVPFMEHHCNRTHREQVYRAYIQRASTGDSIIPSLIGRILTLRKEKAQLLGFETTPISAWIRKWQTT
jgi:oligopeptidase A